MTKFISRVLPAVGLIVDVLLIVDIASDLVKKNRDRKINSTVSSPEADEALAVEA